MSHLPDTASFHERVQDLFVAFRGRGVSLSASDLELVDDWAKREVPFDVVARGIRRAAEAIAFDAAEGDAAPRSLKACRRHVEAEIKKFMTSNAGIASEAPQAAEHEFLAIKHKKLVAFAKRCAKELPAPRALERWAHTAPSAETFEAALRAERLVMSLALRSVPFDRRLQVLKQARGLVLAANLLTADARRESLHVHRAALLRRDVNLPAPW